MRNNVCSVSDTGDSKKNLSFPNRSRTCNLLVTSPDALPLSYMRLVEAKAIKLGKNLENKWPCFFFFIYRFSKNLHY